MSDVITGDSTTGTPSTPIEERPGPLYSDPAFLADLSHELRTPLAVIKGFAQGLLAHWDHLPEPKRHQHIEYILRSTLRLERLVLDLSLAARLSGGVSLQPERVDVHSAAAQAIDEVRAVYGTRSFLLAPPIGTCCVWADHERLLQVLVNLLENAAKYAPRETAVTVRWQTLNESVRIDVCDEGLSLTSEEQRLLFTRFGRLQSSGTNLATPQGTGLGLYICKGLVEVMGGEIGVVPGDQNTGTSSGSAYLPPVPIDSVACRSLPYRLCTL